MKKRYVVELTRKERQRLRQLVSSGKARARKLTHARILLKADSSPGGPNWPDSRIRRAVDVGTATIERVRKRFVEDGLEAALSRRKSNRLYPHKLDGDAEAHLIAIACSEAPQGYQRWTLQLLADRMVQLGHVESLSYETVRRTLKKTNLSPG
jgi:transposase